MEHPEGADIQITVPGHPVFNGMPAEDWPQILGYNKLVAKEGAEVVATCCGDPFITLGTYGKGRTLAFATDCAPHWCPFEFCDWDGYGILWRNMIHWLI